ACRIRLQGGHRAAADPASPTVDAEPTRRARRVFSRANPAERVRENPRRGCPPCVGRVRSLVLLLRGFFPSTQPLKPWGCGSSRCGSGCASSTSAFTTGEAGTVIAIPQLVVELAAWLAAWGRTPLPCPASGLDTRRVEDL